MASSKAQIVPELIFLVVFLLAMGLLLIVANMAQHDINDELQSDDDIRPEAKAAMQTVTTNYAPTWDNAITLLLGLFWIFLLVSSYYIDTHPAFFWINLIIIIFLLSTIVVLSNTYSDLTSDSDLATRAADYPKINYIMNHLVIIILVMALSTGVVLYAKQQ